MLPEVLHPHFQRLGMMLGLGVGGVGVEGAGFGVEGAGFEDLADDRLECRGGRCLVER